MLRPFDQLVGLVRDYSNHYGLSDTDAYKAIRRDLRTVSQLLSGERQKSLDRVSESRNNPN